MFVSLLTICHISPLCRSFIATLQLGLLDCHNNSRKCWNRLILLIMRYITYNEVCIIIHQGLENIETFCQDQDQDFYFKTKATFHVLEASRDQNQGLETTSLHYSNRISAGRLVESGHPQMT